MKDRKTFEPKDCEEKIYNFWLSHELFRPSGEGEPYCIVIPPPNVTGSLHMGHALNATLQDILIRWKRMQGFKTLWLPGTDHAGIATQNVVERLLQKENLTRQILGRDAFIKRVWQWKELSGGQIISQLKRLGASCDWSRERFTMDEGLSRAVREVFVRLFNEGLIYRDYRLINWCPRCQTALSDLEVEYEEIEGRLYYIRYPFSDGKGYITVATTRPETMLGDTAVAVNPEDERYSSLIGKELILPLTNRKINIVGDSAVLKDFGTGAVKVTPAHDFADEEIAKRHGLPSLIVIDRNAKMTPEAGKKYEGLDRYVARKEIISDLKEQGLLEKEERYIHSVGHCYRCKTAIEPLPTLQWYIKIEPLAKPAIEAVRNGRIRIIPEIWLNSYYAWMENIKDWCISRQIWWGHRIPVWYCPECRDSEGRRQGERIVIKLSKPLLLKGISKEKATYVELKEAGFSHSDILSVVDSVEMDKDIKPIVSIDELNKCPECGSELLQDTDVLDTWFSSALWPFSTLGWPEETEDLKTFYPTSVLVTAFDILFFWVARMIMMGLKFMNEVPFRDVYIHAIVRDEKGQKMSKSKGNVIDPLVMIDRYGTDAFRFTLAAFAAQGRDIRFSEERLEGYRAFVNKLWNASRFILMNTEDIKEIPDDGYIEKNRKEFNLPTRWILHRLQLTIRMINDSLNQYRFNDAASSIYQFIWHEFCDWYIEFSKIYLYSEQDSRTASEREDVKKVLVYILEKLLRLLHPFMPFVTEEIWQHLPHKEISIMITPYPEKMTEDPEAEEKISFLIDTIMTIRTIRGELNIPPSKELDLLVKTSARGITEILKTHQVHIKKLARIRDIIGIGEDVKRPKGSAIAVREGFEIYLPLEGIINLEQEINRLKKDLNSVLKEMEFINKKLLNEDFLKKAPPHVVEKERREYESLVIKKQKLIEGIERLKEMQ
ncbi:MAG: valine--tRNA ligase [Thermodesulfovibrionales bacterium]|nr:valine--tRNA ligase [Thermodesulfovibrionales bacterium]